MPGSAEAKVAFVAACLLGLSLTACAGDGQTGDETDLPGDEGHTDSNYTESSCERTRAALSGASGSAVRKQILERAYKWLDASVAYDQTKSYKVPGDAKAYRTDCSGFVSMAWSLSSSLNTAAFSQASGGRRLSSFAALQPGDALLHPKTSREPYAHIMLFAGWEDDDHEQLCAIQMMDTENDMVMSPYNAELLGTAWVPIRKPGL
ncbi:MAG: hypothetical protein U0174_00945 [Polyangiaceae bacterium]